MRIWPERLQAQLAGGLEPVCVIAGDDTLLVEEAGGRVREAASAGGFAERALFDVEKGFDWGKVAGLIGNRSLFATRRLLELRVAGKLGAEGGKALAALAERPAADDLVLVLCPRFDAAARRTEWYKALERRVLLVPIQPLEARELPKWIRDRMESHGLRPDAEAVQLLAERVEGNLLACAQEIDKLALLVGEGPIGAETVAAAVGNSARFDVYALVDAALAGSARRVVRIAADLRAEGVDPVLVGWALSKELRGLARMAGVVATGAPVVRAMQQGGVWDKRKGLVGKALGRLTPGRCRGMLRRAARLDRVVKGVEPGNPWDEVLQLSLALAGVETLRGV